MNFNQFISQFEEELFLQYKYEMKRFTSGQTLQFPPGTFQYDEVETNENTVGYIIKRNTDFFEIYLLNRVFGKKQIWVVKWTGNVEDKNFENIGEALIWMEDTYTRDIINK
jgi:hypothetical protein